MDVVKPFVAAVGTTITQEQYASSYILISSNARPFFEAHEVNGLALTNFLLTSLKRVNVDAYP